MLVMFVIRATVSLTYSVFVFVCALFYFLSSCSDGITDTSHGARMLQGGVKRGLMLRNMQVE